MHPKSVPAGTAFLVSALMIYPAFAAVNVDLERQTMRFDFHVSTKALTPDKYTKFKKNLELALSFCHMLLGVKPILSTVSYEERSGLYMTSWERDMETLIEQEIDILHEQLLNFCDEEDVELEDLSMDGEQFYHFERVFEELFHHVQELDHNLRLRAYRDMGMIYVHRIPGLE
ncbi:MAG: hypothetical protein FWF06_03870 [Symbiobacteriaceae bacterium]|nr:hypothetical protein [Symbiobacteriaceae bacterium]